MAIWREVVGRGHLKMDFEPVAGRPFRQATEVYAFGELAIGFAETDGHIARLTNAHLAGNGDNLMLHIKTSGSSLVSQVGRELKIDAGEAALFTLCETGTHWFPMTAAGAFLCIPRRRLGSLVHDPESALMRLVSAQTPALRLLVDYVNLAMEKHELNQADLQRLFATHVVDLVALTLGATRDGIELAQARGLRAARLQAIKSDIARRFADEGLSVSDVARRHGVTPRYVHMLFEVEGRSFSEFLIEQRLTQAHRLLTNSQLAARTISAIAFEVGFTNLSYFNRCFRRRYGATPSDIREASASANNP